MAVLGVANSFRQLAGQLDDAYGNAATSLTVLWLEYGEKVEPVIDEVVTVLPYVKLIVDAIDNGYLSGIELTEGTPEVLEAVENLADGFEQVPDEPESVELEPEPTSTLIGGPELETLVQQVAAEEAQRQELTAALDQGETAFWGRNAGLEGEARKQAEVMLEEARKEAFRALEARQKQERERDGPAL